MSANLFDGMERRVIVLDGGLGTTLEQTCKIRIADTPLWSAEALSEESGAVVAAHLAFLRAGAQIIETSTYQCSLNTFKRAGYSNDTARQMMHQAISLAQKARSTFNTERQKDIMQGGVERRSTTRPIRLCLSLGPFGASLSPTQEFGGFYPPPHGPRGYSTEGTNLNYFSEDGAEDEAIEALTAFHLERLSLFAEDSEVWSYIDMIAFETVPLAREAISIRRTMALFHEKNKGADKQWWISFVLPEGRCPQMAGTNGRHLTTSDLVWAALSPNPLGSPAGKKLPIPHGLGVNCTAVEHLPRIVGEMEAACKEIGSEHRPFLVLYPNGGDEYDELDRVWKRSDPVKESGWVTRLVDVVESILGSPGTRWSGVIVGGCCRCTPERIGRLVDMLK